MSEHLVGGLGLVVALLPIAGVLAWVGWMRGGTLRVSSWRSQYNERGDGDRLARAETIDPAPACQRLASSQRAPRRGLRHRLGRARAPPHRVPRPAKEGP